VAASTRFAQAAGGINTSCSYSRSRARGSSPANSRRVNSSHRHAGRISRRTSTTPDEGFQATCRTPAGAVADSPSANISSRPPIRTATVPVVAVNRSSIDGCTCSRVRCPGRGQTACITNSSGVDVANAIRSPVTGFSMKSTARTKVHRTPDGARMAWDLLGRTACVRDIAVRQRGPHGEGGCFQALMLRLRTCAMI